MAQFIPSRNTWSEIGQGFGQGATEGYMSRSDDLALQKAIGNLKEDASPRQILDAITNTKTYSPESKQRLLQNHLGIEQFEELKRHHQEQNEIAQEKNRIKVSQKESKVDAENLKNQLVLDGMPDYLADIFTNPLTPPSVKNNISREHNMLKERGIRGNSSQQKHVSEPESKAALQADQNIVDSNQNAIQKPLSVNGEIESQNSNNQKIANVKPGLKVNEWPEIAAPSETTYSEKEKWRTTNQKENNKLLQQTKEKNKSHTNNIIRLNHSAKLNDTHKLPSDIGRVVIDPETGEPYTLAQVAGLVNKETQDFVKTINDFLVDAKTYFGGRVTNFDLQSFKARLPTLMNTEDGRRIIIEQMKLMEELQIAHDKELENGLKHYGRNASYSDIQKVIDERVGVKEEQIITKMDNLIVASDFMDQMANNPQKYKDTKLMQNPRTGKFKAVPPNQVEEAIKRGYIKW